MACSNEFHAAHHSGVRTESAIRHIVMHDEEAPTARSAAAWFQNPASAGSAHVCIDDHECYRTLGDLMIPWGAQGANTSGLHIEQAGYASWKRWQWIKRWRTLNRGAWIAARWSVKYRLGREFCTAHDLIMGRKGVTTHAECTKAFGGTHTDPGDGWPKDRWMRMYRRRRRILRLRKRNR